MTEAYPINSTGGASCDDEGAAAALGKAKWLHLSAAPTFAIMALLTGVLGGDPMDMLCSAGYGSPLNGMVPMYLLMSAFHLAPWLAGLQPAKRCPPVLIRCSPVRAALNLPHPLSSKQAVGRSPVAGNIRRRRRSRRTTPP